MPIYDFECTNCGHQAELMRKMSEPNVTTCSKCMQETLAKQLSAPSFQLNGTGWYATDFKGTAQPSQSTGTKPEAAQSAPASTSCGTGCACH